MPRVSRVLAIAVVAATLFAVPVSAHAALVDTTDMTYEVQLWPEGDPGIAILICGIRLPEGTPLPATVRMPVPPEAELSWAGEIVGDDVSQDIPREVTLVQGVGGNSVEMTLEETLTAQYDAVYRAMNVDDGRFSVVLDWVQTEPAAQVSFAVKIPPSVEDVDISPDPPGTPRENLRGERLFTLQPLALAPGQATQITAKYTRPELAGGTQSFPLLPVLGGALGLAVVILLVVVARQASSTAHEEE